MAIYTYDPSYWPDFKTGNKLEWVLTSGNGGYAGGSLIGGRNRTHQGYLVASLNPPTERYVVLDQICEYVSIGGNDYDLETIQHRGSAFTEGQRYLKRVTYDGTVRFEYELPPTDACESGTCVMSISKHIALLREENTVAINYSITNFSADEASVYLTPKFTFREHNTLTSESDLCFKTLITGDTLSLVPMNPTLPGNRNVRIDLSISEGTYLELRDKYDRDVELQTELELETKGLCTSYMPYDIEIVLSPGEKKTISVVCNVLWDGTLSKDELLYDAVDRFVASGTAQKMINTVREYYKALEDNAHAADKAAYETDGDFFDRLVLDADHFIVLRASTGLKTILAGLPWFTDWGRDTMISFTGLTLCTGRYEDAREILRSFALYEKNGLIPNMFPDNGAKPLYNTADASLWYFIAVHEYIKHTGDKEFIYRQIYPVLLRILDAYEHGTDNDIYMEPSGLIHAGSGLDQVTWMDVRVGDMVVTPRHGCPVEINALWYNALRIGECLADGYNDEIRAKHFRCLADQVESVFEKTYYTGTRPDSEASESEPAGYLYDVVDGFTEGSGSCSTGSGTDFHYEIRDDSIRPNQLYAVSLPFSPVSEYVKRQIMMTVERELYVGVGIRSLSPKHPDYHGEYRGALAKRDLSYHQGTAWGYLLGAYIEAYVKVYGADPEMAESIKKLPNPVKRHQAEENCIGGICEIFEGDPPYKGRGCYTQAWSTGEILRILHLMRRFL